MSSTTVRKTAVAMAAGAVKKVGNAVAEAVRKVTREVVASPNFYNREDKINRWLIRDTRMGDMPQEGDTTISAVIDNVHFGVADSWAEGFGCRMVAKGVLNEENAKLTGDEFEIKFDGTDFQRCDPALGDWIEVKKLKRLFLRPDGSMLGLI